MRFIADLHVHSKYSRATSKDCDLEHLAVWARKKGIAVVGTGDFTHPAWRAELKDKLVPAEGTGLFRLRPDIEREVAREVPPSCRGAETRFMLQVEISTIYKKDDKTRKVHHAVYAPDFGAADRFAQSLGAIGNISSDGRPILGLDSRDLLEIALESGPHSYLIPAHAWTPWFAVLGSRSGFDTVDACYGDLATHVFAIETGLSSDPPMNWRVSGLDRFRLVSNSDAHSPPKLGREATIFDTTPDYHAIRCALETGEGYVGTVELFPEEGKYHLDGHRKCDMRLWPRETLEAGGKCPVCGKPVTVGVMHRVELLADRDEPAPPPTAGEVRSLIPLAEIIGEIEGVGPNTKTVKGRYEALLGRLGPELGILGEVPLEDVARTTSSLVAEGLDRLRRGEVIREAGYDGEYGVIRLFRADELPSGSRSGLLFPLDEPKASEPWPAPEEPARTEPALPETAETPELPPGIDASGTLSGLDSDQRAAAEVCEGPLLIVAGPGSGKTRTLTHRLAYLVRERGVPAEQLLAITFTRRAAAELRERLEALLPERWHAVTVHTFHSLGLAILREASATVGLAPDFSIADEAERASLLVEALGVSERAAKRLLGRISHARRTGDDGDDPELSAARQAYRRALRARGMVDFDDLVAGAVRALASDASVCARWRERYPRVSIDEYQDVDAEQYRLVRLLVPPGGNLCVIGDPDQAIYGFRGADVGFFRRFAEDFPTARTFHLGRNYRSGRLIVDAAAQVIAPSGSELRARAMSAVDPRRLVIAEAPTERAEAEQVVHTIEQLLGGHSFFSLDSGRSESGASADLAFSDFAVLYRTSAQADALCEALERSGMPYQRRSHELLSERPGVATLLAALGREPGSTPVTERVDAAATAAIEGGADPLETRAAADLLAALAASYSSDLPRFVAELPLVSEVDTWDPRAERIALLTLHAAKGLEFRVVFMVGCEDGLLPLRFGPEDVNGDGDGDDSEERRLFYVGMTRAEERLYLFRAKRRLWRGRVREAAPSPYLLEIADELLERRQAAAHRKMTPEDDGGEQLTLL